MEFSLIVAIRDTPRERRFVERSLRAAVALRPTETIIGVDKPTDSGFLDIIETASSGHANAHTVKVERSGEWKMRLAHVLHECIKAASHEKILLYNIDSILQRRMLGGYDRVGPQTPMIMYQERRPVRTLRDLITGIIYRTNQIIRPPNTGTYWIYRRSYFDHVDFAKLRSVYNGCDTILIEQFQSKGKDTVAESTIGANSLDYNNNDIPWRQFANGVWYGANPDKLTGYFAGSPNFKIRVKSILLDMPYLYRGFTWARKNPNHPTVKDARSKAFLDFIYQGSNPVKDILDWKKIGKLGTGYT